MEMITQNDKTKQKTPLSYNFSLFEKEKNILTACNKKQFPHN